MTLMKLIPRPRPKSPPAAAIKEDKIECEILGHLSTPAILKLLRK